VVYYIFSVLASFVTNISYTGLYVCNITVIRSTGNLEMVFTVEYNSVDYITKYEHL